MLAAPAATGLKRILLWKVIGGVLTNGATAQATPKAHPKGCNRAGTSDAGARPGENREGKRVAQDHERVRRERILAT